MGSMWGSGAIWAILRRPWLWGEAVRTVGAMAPQGWWRRPPFLPVPERTYMEWRRATAYGTSDEPAAADDIVHYLQWRRRYRAVAKKGASVG